VGKINKQVAEKSGQNRIILSRDDANSALQPEDVDDVADIIRSASILICQLEVPLETVERALSIAHAAGVTTIFNPAPAVPNIPHSLLHTVDYLIPNETEAEIMLGNDYKVDSVSAALDGASELMRRGVRKAVIITLGDKGIVVFKRDGQLRTFAARAVPKVVDTTGAGDCFVGGFAVGLAERGLAVEGAAHVGLAAAALSVQKQGALDSMPFRNEMAWSGN
jgi:ribokinase